jgi:hypothetical protein
MRGSVSLASNFLPRMVAELAKAGHQRPLEYDRESH